MKRPFFFLVLLLPGCLPAGGADAPPTSAASPEALVAGYINAIPAEEADARTQRLKQIADRRAGTPILVHRGATRFAPENTLEAFAAAVDHGADGVEFDIRRSRDGVLYLLHDDTLERTTHGTGKARERTYFELLECRVRGAIAGGPKQPRIATLAAALLLARQRAMLLHLDVKEPGLQDDIEKLLDAADVWDHLVDVNAGNAERLRAHPRVKLLRYKGWLPQGGSEPDLPAIRRFLESDGEMVFCKHDPAWAVRALDRRTPEPVPLPDDLYAVWSPTGVVVRVQRLPSRTGP